VQITVVGAGIIGLTTALTLEEQGHTVRIVAAGSGPQTTSAVAGAVWFPYRAGPPAKVAAWSAQTRAWLEQLSRDPDAGIDLLTGYEITYEEGLTPPIPWWAANIEVTREPAPVIDGHMAWKFHAPRVEPARFLPWIMSRLRATIEYRAVFDLAAEPGDAVINCTGLAARELAGDDLIYPLLGQTVITDPGGVDLAVSITDHRNPDSIFYVIPRRDELVLGGCSLPWPPGAPPEINPEITARILAQARSLGLSVGRVRTERVGLRPYRLEVRLERDGRIIHNYGHGGAGFTMCRGCAEEVARVITTL
jgi:D-amino-acid oxidase